MTGYAICATPRSGSTLLCALLRASAVAGWPESWFRRQSMANYAKAWGIGADWSDYLAAALKAGRGANGVFGLRLMWETLVEVEARLGPGLPGLGLQRFIWLRRGDLVGQAVSRYRAEVSGTWHLGFEEALHPVEPVYDFARIAAWLDDAAVGNRAWAAWFAARGIVPLIVDYEVLAAEPVAVAERVLAHLGLVAASPLTVSNRRMAEDVSAAWVARFRAEKLG